MNEQQSDDCCDDCYCRQLHPKLYISIFMSELKSQIDLCYARLHFNETNLKRKNKLLNKWLKLINKIDSIETQCRHLNCFKKTVFFFNQKLFIFNNECFSKTAIDDLTKYLLFKIKIYIFA